MYALADGVLYAKDDEGDVVALAGAQAAIKSISAGLQRATEGQVVFSNSNAFSFGLNGSTVTARLPSVSHFDNQAGAPTFANSVATNSAAPNVSFQRFSVPLNLTATQLDYLAHLTVAASQAYSSTMAVVLYTMNGSTAGSISSASGTNNAAAGQYTNHSGTRWRSIPLGTWNLTPGDYLIGFAHSLQGPAGTTGSVTIYGESNIPLNPNPGGAAVTDYFAEGIGIVASAIPPPTIELSQINGSAAAAGAQPYFRIVGTL